MGRELVNAFGLISDRRQAKEAEVLLRRLGFTSKVLDVNAPIAGLSGGEQEGVAIARALHFKARLLILDEPTTALSLTQSQQVLDLVFRVRDAGVGVVFISHNVAHAHRVGDHFLVLDRGEIAARFSEKRSLILISSTSWSWLPREANQFDRQRLQGETRERRHDFG